MKELEQLIKEMGYKFRDLIYHTDGYYTCSVGYEFRFKHRGFPPSFEGKTPLEAVKKAKDFIDKIEGDIPEKLDI